MASKGFNLGVKDDRGFDLCYPQVSQISYKMSLCQCLGNESYETLGTCNGVEHLQISSNYTRVGSKLSLKNRVRPCNYELRGYFKIRIEVCSF